MPFNWNDFPAEAALSGDFLKEEEKIAMTVNKVPFFVTGVHEETVDFGKGKGPQQVWKVQMILQDGSERVASFTKGIPARDKQIAGLRDYLATADAEPVATIFVKVGRSYQLQGAE